MCGCADRVAGQAVCAVALFDRGDFVGNTEPGDNPADLVVRVQGPRLRVDAVPPIQNQRLDPVLRSLIDQSFR